MHRREQARCADRRGRTLRSPCPDELREVLCGSACARGQREGDRCRDHDGPRVGSPKQYSGERQRTDECHRERGDQDMSGFGAEMQFPRHHRADDRDRGLIDDDHELGEREHGDARHHGPGVLR